MGVFTNAINANSTSMDVGIDKGVKICKKPDEEWSVEGSSGGGLSADSIAWFGRWGRPTDGKWGDFGGNYQQKQMWLNL